MKLIRKEKFHPCYINEDMERIYQILGEEKFVLFEKQLEHQIRMLHKYPIENTAALKKPILSDYGYRKVLFHSENQKLKADMRLIYRYIEKTDTLQFLGVGFRWDTPKTIYNVLEERDNLDFIGI